MLLEFDCVEEPKETKEEDVFPSGEDSEIYRKTIEKMLHSKDVSPLMKKVLEKEMKQAKVSGSEEKELLHQADKAIHDLESGLKDGSIPSFLKPFAEGVLPKMRSIRDRAYQIAEDGKNSEKAGSKVADEVRVSESKEGGSERVSEKSAKKSSEKSTDKSSTDKTTDKSSTDKTTDKTTDNTSDTPPPGSDFMNSLNRKSPEHNDFFVVASPSSHP